MKKLNRQSQGTCLRNVFVVLDYICDYAECLEKRSRSLDHRLVGTQDPALREQCEMRASASLILFHRHPRHKRLLYRKSLSRAVLIVQPVTELVTY